MHIFLYDYASREKKMLEHMPISGGDADSNESRSGGKVTKEKNKEKSVLKNLKYVLFHLHKCIHMYLCLNISWSHNL